MRCRGKRILLREVGAFQRPKQEGRGMGIEGKGKEIAIVLRTGLCVDRGAVAIRDSLLKASRNTVQLTPNPRHHPKHADIGDNTHMVII